MRDAEGSARTHPRWSLAVFSTYPSGTAEPSSASSLKPQRSVASSTPSPNKSKASKTRDHQWQGRGKGYDGQIALVGLPDWPNIRNSARSRIHFDEGCLAGKTWVACRKVCRLDKSQHHHELEAERRWDGTE